MVSAQLATMIGRWCNGNTTGFGSVIPGSNPSRPTKGTLDMGYPLSFLAADNLYLLSVSGWSEKDYGLFYHF